MTIWKEQLPGFPMPDVYDATEETGEPSFLLADCPDWVRRPDTGERLRVQYLRIRELECPQCGAMIRARVLVLERGLQVIECRACQQFLFCQSRETGES